MQSLLSFFRMHWDHETADRAVASWTAPVLWRFRLARRHCQCARRLAQNLAGRPMVLGKPPFVFFRMHWVHKPTPNPSQEGNRQDADDCLLPSWVGGGSVHGKGNGGRSGSLTE